MKAGGSGCLALFASVAIVLAGYQEGQKITLTKNRRFYDPKLQKLAGIELIQVSTGPPE